MLKKQTTEQNSIIGSDGGDTDVIRVTAFAGTGKTYTLVKLAEHLEDSLPDAKILYLAYNRSVRKEAVTQFPYNTTVHTCHSLAYSALGTMYRAKLQNNLRKTAVKDLLMEYTKLHRRQWRSGAHDNTVSMENVELMETLLECDKRCWSSKDRKFRWALTYIVTETVNAYMYSGDRYIGPQHVKDDLAEQICDREGFQPAVVHLACHLYGSMADIKNPFPCTHDVYLKEYVNMSPDLGRIYDYIMLDEAQDANGAINALMTQIQGACKVFVGDPHQQIYEWRGSVNAMGQLEPTQDFALTRSFRFGTDLSELATKILATWKDEPRDIEGTGDTAISHCLNIKELPPKTTLLARTNAQVIMAAAALATEKKTFKIAGGIPWDYVQIVKDVYNIMNGLTEKQDQYVRTDYLQLFKEPEELVMYAEAARDQAVLSASAMIERFGGQVFETLKKVTDNCSHSDDSMEEEGIDYILSTAHKAKGSEWGRVYLCKDFVTVFYSGLHGTYAGKGKLDILFTAIEHARPLPETYDNTPEANLLYVAATRAQKALVMHPKVAAFMENHFKGKL